ncbi:MAG TPA: hypothetical protein VF179_12140 [Thermoanaerobaculia bacterium]|nr:hypothetical protein [Thermoanaerobaculia bacterium]
MYVDIHAQRIKARRTIFAALLAGLALLLSAPSARADHGQQPDASCGFTGVKTLVLRPGGQLPLPPSYQNLTGLTWTFYYIVMRDDLPFNLPGELLSATLGGPLTLPPYSGASLPGLAYTLPLSTRVGTGRLTYWVFANSTSPTGTRIVNPAKCEYDLTVKPLFGAFGGTEDPSADHR